MDTSAEGLIKTSNKDHVSKEQLDNRQNENKVQGQGYTLASEKFRPTVEPVLVLMIIAETVSVSVVTNFFEYKSCETVFNISAADCLNMSRKVEAEVQVVTADLLMWKSLIESLLPAVLSFFVGPWSDVNGRKLLFSVSICGFLCYHVSWVIMSVLPNLPLHYYLLASLPKALTGGWVVIFLASYCYMVDITRIEDRTFRIGIMESGLIMGYGLGFFLSPIFFQFGFPVVFGVSALLTLICLFYSYFCLKETIHPERGVSYNVFDWRYVYDMLSTTFYKRPHNRRCIVFLLLVSFYINIVIFVGENSVLYLWLKLQFHWELSDFTTYQIISVTIIGLGSMGYLWVFSSKLNLPDLPLATVIISTRIFSSVILGFAIFPWQIYAASCVAVFSGANGSLLRAAVSKIIPKHEIGKVFALIAALEAVAPLAASPLYTLVYDYAIHTSASFVFMVSAFLYTIILICFVMMMIIQWQYPAAEYSTLNDGSIEA